MTRRIDHDLDSLPRTEVMQHWWAMMGDIMRPNPDQSPVRVDLQPMFVLS